jgi:hypothetical protein
VYVIDTFYLGRREKNDSVHDFIVMFSNGLESVRRDLTKTDRK